MQQFVRTINTSDAFKMKLEQLEREYRIKLESINNDIRLKEQELDRYRKVGIGGELGGGFLLLLSWIGFIIGSLATMIGIMMASEESRSDVLAVGMIMCVVGVFCIILGAIFRVKGLSIRRTAMEKQKEAAKHCEAIESELAKLREELKHLENYYQAEMSHQRQLYERHMLNQQELIEQEVSAIQHHSASTADMKECPKCAEIVKARAKICRFCGHEFNE
ncbi:zinc ribbon domain-containing protein [Brevibacillus sp. GCM10020057]|uniref:zinc ribbon domain-containing protein n=1 Tax=Brevibacillus sp. GCM10020057 TaxID=3317327 RepID=UPI00363B3955